MPTFTAMFENRADAERIQAELERLGIIDTDGQQGLYDKSSAGYSDDQYSGSSNKGFWGDRASDIPDEDRHTYEEGVRRGNYVLTVNTDDERAQQVHDILENSNAVDVDESSSSWKKEGWKAPAAGLATAATAAPAAMAATSAKRTGTDEVIPVVEEQLAVGKREVSRGGVRVRSFVKETPVHEQVSLREEHVDVERRQVNQPLSAANLTGDAFQERSIEMTETAEEAVVAKNARVVEEVVVRKDVNERVEQIDDTVRRTEVEVERLGNRDGVRDGGDRSAMFDGDRKASDLDRDGRGAASEGAGMGNEAIGNIKQGLGAAVGSDSLRKSGEAQERRGESQQGKPSDRG